MNKDLFENRIGEALRGAESTPPSGAWDFIKSQIPTQYTPPFKFPTWAVVGVMSTMLAGMSMMETTPEESTAVTESASSHESIAEKVTPNAMEEINFQTDQFTQNQELVEESLVEEGLSSVGGIELIAEEITQVEPGEQAISVETSSTEKVVAPESLDAEPNVSFNNNNSEKTSNLVIDNPPTPASVEEEVLNPNDTQEAALEKHFIVDGIKECFTPCELRLSATGTAESYSWETGLLGSRDGDQLDLIIEEPQTVVVFATAKYKGGAEEVITHEVVVKPGSKLFIPNSFTPNGDGVNDSYAVSGSGITEFSLSIINSNGKVVHQATDMANAWSLDGVSSEMEGEIYIAVVRARGVDGKVYEENVRLTINPN
ncbi:MAG: gliding motility-associated C-terminal domain-containing protein [Bacteroidota bacterium]